MKNKLAYFLFFAGLMAAAGCKKSFLEDMKSYDKFDESMFTSEVLTGSYIDRIYNLYFAAYKNPSLTVVGLYDNTRQNSTDEFGGTVTNLINPTTQLLQASQADTYFGGITQSKVENFPYTRIRYSNFLIEKINEGVAQVLSEDFKKTAKGQAYFLRALQYFDLVRLYGGVPLVLNTQQADADDETIKIPRSKTSEVIDQIVKDLDSAAVLLPMKWASGGTDYGRFTAASAMAMKSRVLLTAASPLFNKNWDNAGDARWQKALDAGLAAETALTAGGYGSYVTNASTWADATYKNDNAFNAEALMVQLLSNTASGSTGINNSWENSVRPKDYNGGGGIAATKYMLDLFPLADGSRPVIGTNYNDTFFFEGRDPRFYRTFTFSGVKWPIKNNPNKVTWFYRWRESASKAASSYANNQGNSPAFVRKMSNPNADSTTFVNSGTDIFEYRYAELLLNIAEAYAAKGDIANCVAYLVKIRKRVYPSSASANNYGIGTPASKYAALEACLYERQVELAYEGKRFWDLQRWMLYDDEGTDQTNAKLGIAKLNGTSRQGYYWQFKTFSAKDQLTDADRIAIVIDPDASATDFKNNIEKLKALFQAKFQMTPLDQAWDRVSNVAVNIQFRPNYYIGGLHSSLLTNNTWITQTIDWQDQNGAMGTFNYQD
jgi:starch-binding outer membrane protein, SusD/RagB family